MTFMAARRRPAFVLCRRGDTRFAHAPRSCPHFACLSLFVVGVYHTFVEDEAEGGPFAKAYSVRIDVKKRRRAE
jgi:hypothetical protein